MNQVDSLIHMERIVKFLDLDDCCVENGSPQSPKILKGVLMVQNRCRGCSQEHPIEAGDMRRSHSSLRCPSKPTYLRGGRRVHESSGRGSVAESSENEISRNFTIGSVKIVAPDTSHGHGKWTNPMSCSRLPSAVLQVPQWRYIRPIIIPL